MEGEVEGDAVDLIYLLVGGEERTILSEEAGVGLEELETVGVIANVLLEREQHKHGQVRELEASSLLGPE